jgi:hypothetical protein
MSNQKLPEFKPGQRAWCSLYDAWGTVRKCGLIDHPLEWIGDEGGLTKCVTMDGKDEPRHKMPILFHREQTFDFSEPEPEIGTWGYFWDIGADCLIFGAYAGKTPTGRHLLRGGNSYINFSTGLPEHIKKMMEGGK